MVRAALAPGNAWLWNSSFMDTGELDCSAGLGVGKRALCILSGTVWMKALAPGASAAPTVVTTATTAYLFGKFLVQDPALTSMAGADGSTRSLTARGKQ